MQKLSRGILAVLFLIAAGVAAPASAGVIYNLTFKKSASTVATGTLDLNFATIPQAFNLNQSLAGILNSVTTTNLDGMGTFNITAANLASGSQIQTGNVGQIYTLTAVETGPVNSLDLNLYTSTWQIHGVNNSTVDSGSLVIAGPTLSAPAAVPEPISLSLFGAGLAGAAALRRRKSKKVAA